MSQFDVTLFMNYRFDSMEKSSSLFTFLNERADVFLPVRYDDHEPPRRPYKSYNPQDIVDPSRLLSGSPDGRYGRIFLKGAKFKGFMAVSWGMNDRGGMTLSLDRAFFTKQERIEGLFAFVEAFCEMYSIVYGYGASIEDWEATHRRRIESPDGGSIDIKVQEDFDHCLPGVYWMTLFGPTLTSYFGRDVLMSLSGSRPLELGKDGVGVILDDPHPFASSQSERFAQGREIATRLGQHYFFDPNDIAKTCAPIPGVTPGGPPDATVMSRLTQAERHMDTSRHRVGAMTTDAFERREVLDHEGADGEPRVPQTDPEVLAADFVVYLHMDVPEVFEASRTALVALDTYFAGRPPTREYKPEFLLNDFVPRLGAFIGHVFIRQGIGEWSAHRPVMTSRVVAGTTEIDPFWLAFRATYDHSSLVDAYDRAIASINK